MSTREITPFNKRLRACSTSLVVFLLLVCILITNSYAASITLKWNRNQEPDIAGYQIFWGTKSRQYSNRITISDTARTPVSRNYTINGLKEGVTYYFALKAVDLAGQLSPFSQEVVHHIKSTVPNFTDFDLPNNRIPNGSVEKGGSSPESWNFMDWSSRYRASGEVPGGWSTKEAHTGSHSLWINNEKGTMAGWSPGTINFSHPYPKVLAIGGWSKARGVSQNSWLYGLVCLVFFEDNSYKWFFSNDLQYDRGSHGWQLRSVVKKWDKGVKKLILYATLYAGTGSVWFDDIFVVPSPSNMIINGDFELVGKNAEPVNWEFFDSATDEAEINPDPSRLVADENHNSNYAVTLNNQTGSRTGWRGADVVFEKPYPKTLILSGWSKALEVDSTTKFYGLDFRVEFEDGTVKWFGPRELRFALGTHEWEKRYITKSWDKGIKSVRPYCLLYYGVGVAWFDDISIKAVW